MSYRTGTALARLVELARQAPPQFHLNDDDAQSAQVSLTLGLAALGRLMTFSEAVSELDERELTSIGDLIWTLAETNHQITMMLGEHAMAAYKEVLIKEATQAKAATH